MYNNSSYKSLNPKKDFRQQIKSIFKICKIQQGQIATFPSPINIKHLSTDEIGICHECNKKRPYKNWCNPCYSSHFRKSFRKWTSGNKLLDKFIRKSQLSSISRMNCLEWIPRYHLTDVELLCNNDSGSVYSAIWIDGFIIDWNKSEKFWNRCNYGVKVILKTFMNHNDDEFVDFLREPKAHLNCCIQNAHISSFYGFTQDPITNEYLMVLEYSSNGTLRNFIQENPDLLDWKYRSIILENIALGLRTIHSANLIHGNLHTGNILQDHSRSIISDFKFSMKHNDKNDNSFPSSNTSSREVYGVIPFMAPEVLGGQHPTLSSDIYSFGIIMWELSSFNPPFHDKAHDVKLIMELFNGCRPDVVKGTPDAYVSLMKRCWHSDPTKRPTAEELVYLVKELSTYTCFKKINLSEKESLKINLTNSLKNTHPLATYSSKLLPTLYTDHNQDDNEDDNDQLSEYDESVESAPALKSEKGQIIWCFTDGTSYVGILSNHTSLVERQEDVCTLGYFKCPGKDVYCPIDQTCVVNVGTIYCYPPVYETGLICADYDVVVGLCKDDDIEDYTSM
ncbi:kinase-like domain-containing protein [Rhizophagus clarus]|uniref:Kinase-like domain-containing protein n=1 Tax=Rhizophagus clarus TaxID=94130 RepID=A0A8H3L6C8_9GLOM|nr:kinase-like domain-containing protein [Rhizophagus clarus]